MRLVAYDLKDLGTVRMARCKNQKLIEEFLASDMECAKIEGFTQKDAHSCVSSLNTAITRFNFAGVRAITKNGEAFLIKTNK